MAWAGWAEILAFQACRPAWRVFRPPQG